MSWNFPLHLERRGFGVHLPRLRRAKLQLHQRCVRATDRHCLITDTILSITYILSSCPTFIHHRHSNNINNNNINNHNNNHINNNHIRATQYQERRSFLHSFGRRLQSSSHQRDFPKKNTFDVSYGSLGSDERRAEESYQDR